MFRRNFIYVLGALFLTAGGLLAQQPPVEARIAGLENNEEYMSLLREDARLQEREDSIVNAVAVLRERLREDPVRERLREDPVQRQRYSQEILQLESRIFEIRNAKGRLIDRINSIEQEWVLANLDGAVPGSGAVRNTPVSGIPDSLKVRNLVDNLYFREHLAETDYAALCEAQRLETRAAEYVNRYFANHATLTELAETYGTVQNEAEAMDIFGRLTALQGVNRMLGDSLAEVWNYIFDNKNYAYGYILDELGREEILSREEEELARAARQLTELRGATASDAVADYFLRKRVMVDYEGAVAGELALDAARDSLRGVAEQIGAAIICIYDEYRRGKGFVRAAFATENGEAAIPALVLLRGADESELDVCETRTATGITFRKQKICDMVLEFDFLEELYASSFAGKIYISEYIAALYKPAFDDIFKGDERVVVYDRLPRNRKIPKK